MLQCCIISELPRRRAFMHVGVVKQHTMLLNKLLYHVGACQPKRVAALSAIISAMASELVAPGCQQDQIVASD